MQYQMNPYAPSGLAVPSFAGAEDVYTIYVYSRTLTANQVVTSDSLSLDTDSDFYLRGMVRAAATGAFTYKIADESGYYLSNANLSSNSLPPNAALPLPIVPQIRYSAGGRITIDITDTSGAENTIELHFIGFRRYNRA